MHVQNRGAVFQFIKLHYVIQIKQEAAFQFINYY